MVRTFMIAGASAAALTLTTFAPSLFSLFRLATAASAQAIQSEVRIIAHEIHIRENGSFLGKLWHEMDTPQFTGAVTAVCVYFDCEIEVPFIEKGIDVTQPMVGDDYFTTGRLDKHVGEEWWIAFPAPAGYVACAATKSNLSADSQSATSGTIFRNPSTGENWLGSYDEVPQHRPEPHSVDVSFVVKYVVAGTEAKHKCVSNGTRIW
jgi:hypothetical protein